MFSIAYIEIGNFTQHFMLLIQWIIQCLTCMQDIQVWKKSNRPIKNNEIPHILCDCWSNQLKWYWHVSMRMRVMMVVHIRKGICIRQLYGKYGKQCCISHCFIRPNLFAHFSGLFFEKIFHDTLFTHNNERQQVMMDIRSGSHGCVDRHLQACPTPLTKCC